MVDNDKFWPETPEFDPDGFYWYDHDMERNEMMDATYLWPGDPGLETDNSSRAFLKRKLGEDYVPNEDIIAENRIWW